MTQQLDFFAEQSVARVLDAAPPAVRNPCPACGAPGHLLSCAGDRKELVYALQCGCCGERFERRVVRTDICPHDVHRSVPCAACGRTWAEIDARTAGGAS